MTTPLGSDVQLPGATNDKAGSAAIRPALTVFPTDQLSSLPRGSVIDEGGRRLQVVRHGTFQISATDGSVTFTPWTGLTGTVAVRYRISDAAGATDDGLLTVVVTAGGTGDDAFTFEGVKLSVDLLANDFPGRNADGTAGTIDRTSARFPDQDSDQGVTISADRRTLTYPRVGVLTLDDKGVLTFDPTSAPPGTAVTIAYTARDNTKAADGTVEHHSYSGFVRLGVDRNEVSTTDDVSTTPFNTSVTLPGSLNDKDSNPNVPIRPDFSRFWSSDADLGPGDYLSPDNRLVYWAGKGTFSINPDGSVLFVPTPGFAGRSGAELLVSDAEGNRSQEEIIVTVEPGPRAVPDIATARQNVTKRFFVLANDSPGTSADGRPGAIDPTSVRFNADGQPNAAV
ncbi:MAG: Ig-like domain-containing protein, partial [Janthinobacterium lividum]